MRLSRPSLAVLAVMLCARAGAGAAASTPAPFQCPEQGPNGGHAPQAMAKTAGTILLLCADLEQSDGKGQVASSAAVFDSAAPGPARPIWSAADAVGRFHIEPVPDGGFSVTTETLLPRAGKPYEWTPITQFDVRCADGRCGRQPPHCALTLDSSERRDLLGTVRQAARVTPEASVLQRLVDDLTVQALAGDDVAAWALAHLEAIVHIDGGQRDNLASARAVLDQAAQADCDAFRAWKEPPPAPLDPKALGAHVRTPREQAEFPRSRPEENANTATQSLEAVGWLVGGTWAGTGTLSDGRVVQAEESYHWGPGRHSIRFTAKTGAAAGAKADGVIFFENAAGKVVLWNVRPQGGLSESLLSRTDATGCSFQGSDGRSVLTRNGVNQVVRTVEQLQGASWAMLVNLQLQRRTP